MRPAPERDVHRAGPPRLPAALVAAALALQAVLFWLAAWPAARRPWGDEIMYLDLAQRWARGEGAALEPLWPPLYPQLLAAALRLGDAHLLGLRLLQVALLFVAALALCGLAERLLGSAAAGRWAAALLLLDPQVAAFGHYYWPEALHLALFLGTLWLLVLRPRAWWAVALAGLLLGLALLTKSLLLPFLPLLLVPPCLELGWRRGLPRAALALGLALLVTAPTVTANVRRHGLWAVADSSRFNLWVGLNDRSRRNLVDEVVGDEYRRWRESAPDLAGRERRLREETAALVAERGLRALLAGQLGKQYFRLFDRDSFFSDQLPGGAIAAQGYGYVAAPAGPALALRLLGLLAWTATLVAAAFGLVRLLRSPSPWLVALLVFLAGQLLLFLGLHVKTRYRLGFLPVLDLLAAAALARCGTPPRAAGWLAGGLLAALLLCLAFAGRLLD